MIYFYYIYRASRVIIMYDCDLHYTPAHLSLSLSLSLSIPSMQDADKYAQR
jgi:hypothetical protein